MDPEALFCGGNCTLAEAYRMLQVSVPPSPPFIQGKMGKRVSVLEERGGKKKTKRE